MPAETLKHRLARSFQIYDVDPDDEVEASFSSADPQQMVQMFDALKTEVAKDDCFPLLLKRKDDYALYVVQKPEQKPVKAWLHYLLFVATFVTTAFAGALVAHGYDATLDPSVDPGAYWTTPFLLKGALMFALPLMLILGVHEGAHFWAARRRGVDVSYPFFIPIPPPFTLTGTMGAVINLRDPIPNRRALMDIGASGPIAGFIVAVAVIALGLVLSTAVPAAVAPVDAVDDGTTSVLLQDPLVVVALGRLIDVPDGATPHPLYFAGWVGMFITAMNLLPGGTLDGGHVARALFGPGAKWVAYASLAAMVVLGVLGLMGSPYGWIGWLVLAVLLVMSGVVHPQPLNDVTPLDSTGKIVGWTAVAILVLTFTPIPLSVG